MSAMKAQISQLTNMLQKSLELQIDIQRSIKQEVAAAMNQHTAQQANTGLYLWANHWMVHLY